MSKGLNQVFLLGRLTRDVEIRQTQSGKNVASFSLAVSKFGKDEGADFFEVTAWDKLADLLGQYTRKGSKVLVAGRLQQDTWEQDGNKRSKISVVAYDVTFLDSKDEGGQQGPRSSSSDSPINLDDIPF